MIQKQSPDIAPDRETFNYLTRPKSEGGAGLNPSQAYAQMHPHPTVNLMTPNDAKDIADAIENGDQPPTLQGLYRNAGPVRAELARRGFNLARAETDWKATQRYMATLNAPQQVRLRQAIETAGDSLDKIQSLYDEWQKLAPVSGFKVANHAALVAMKNLPAQAAESLHTREVLRSPFKLREDWIQWDVLHVPEGILHLANQIDVVEQEIGEECCHYLGSMFLISARQELVETRRTSLPHLPQYLPGLLLRLALRVRALALVRN